MPARMREQMGVCPSPRPDWWERRSIPSLGELNKERKIYEKKSRFVD